MSGACLQNVQKVSPSFFSSLSSYLVYIWFEETCKTSIFILLTPLDWLEAQCLICHVSLPISVPKANGLRITLDFISTHQVYSLFTVHE